MQSCKISSFGRRVGSGIVASLACSAITSTTTAIALCEDKDDSGNGDDDFIAKIKAKMSSQSLPDIGDMQNSEVLNTLATTLGSNVSLALSSGIPTDLSYGFFAGYFSGLALKKVGKVASVTLGLGFLGLQTLAYNGYIEVHHEKLQQEVEKLLDRNNDGVVDADDVKSVLEDVRKVAGFGLDGNGDKKLLASGGGFGMGFYGGLRSG